MLKTSLVVGETHSVQRRVKYEDSTLSFGRKGIETLFSTTGLVEMMIQAAVELVGDKIPKETISVTKHMSFTHYKPSLQGMFITVTAELVDISGNVLKFKLTCYDELGKIAEATQERHVVNKDGLIQRAHKRAESIEGRIQ